jgi:Host cell surface-exposed lipoprotein
MDVADDRGRHCGWRVAGAPEEGNLSLMNVPVTGNTRAQRRGRHMGAPRRYSSFSRQSLIEQLVFEGFTSAQATYGATQNGL